MLPQVIKDIHISPCLSCPWFLAKQEYCSKLKFTSIPECLDIKNSIDCACLRSYIQTNFGSAVDKNMVDNWRVGWKKGVRYFTQKWTLSKTFQISHAVLFRCVKQRSACFLLKFASFWKHYVCKKPVFVVTSAHDRKDGKQNIDLL